MKNRILRIVGVAIMCCAIIPFLVINGMAFSDETADVDVSEVLTAVDSALPTEENQDALLAETVTVVNPYGISQVTGQFQGDDLFLEATQDGVALSMFAGRPHDVFHLSVYENGEQLSGNKLPESMTVSIKIPDNVVGGKNPQVYYYDHGVDGQWAHAESIVESTVSDGYITFLADKLGGFVVVDDVLDDTQPTPDVAPSESEQPPVSDAVTKPDDSAVPDFWPSAPIVDDVTGGSNTQPVIVGHDSNNSHTTPVAAASNAEKPAVSSDGKNINICVQDGKVVITYEAQGVKLVMYLEPDELETAAGEKGVLMSLMSVLLTQLVG